MVVSPLEDALARYWGYTAFRPLQRETMETLDFNHADNPPCSPGELRRKRVEIESGHSDGRIARDAGRGR